jgi:MYXO-CTERM domain-containing protein
MKRAIVVGAALAMTGVAQAQFEGYYAPENWTFYDEAGGFLDESGVPDYLTIFGGDSSVPGYTQLTIAAGADGTFAFDWAYDSIDSPGYDEGGYIYNGGYYFLSDTYGESGSVSFEVGAGEEIGFYVYTYDGVFGPGELTISNFSAPVPAPGALALLGLAGLASSRRRR